MEWIQVVKALDEHTLGLPVPTSEAIITQFYLWGDVSFYDSKGIHWQIFNSNGVWTVDKVTP